MITPRELQKLYEQGQNITAYLREHSGSDGNTDQMIEIAYDLQSGSYVEAMRKPAMAEHKQLYAAEIARVISSLCEPTSVMEAGIGEATTLSGVLRAFNRPVESYGFDLSWSRVAFARRWLTEQGLLAVKLCTGNLFHIPFADDAIDVVYTSHTVEPNGGNEAPILKELYRVARRYLVLLEPAYELGSPEAQARMEKHGYCRNLPGVAEQLGYRVLRHELFPHIANPLNPTGLTVIEKLSTSTATHTFACPRYRTPLQEFGGMLFSPEALCVYPVIGGIPCLRIENAIFASKYPMMVPT